MKSSNFVIQLKDTIPSKDKLMSLTVSDDFVIKFMQSNNLKARELDFVPNDDALVELITNYDVSTLEIGMITLNSDIIEEENCYIIGKVEIDLLIINKYSHKIQVVDCNNLNHLMWDCASSSDKFLDALVYCNKFFNDRIFNDNLWDDTNLILKHIEEVTAIAGGKEYGDFYKMLLGYFED